MLQFRLADRLHKTLDEIKAIPVAEFIHWLAYFKILQEKS